jgi:hypothetical protein
MIQNSNAVQYQILLFGTMYWYVKMITFLISQDVSMLVSVRYTESIDQIAYNVLSVDQKTELKENRKKDAI